MPKRESLSLRILISFIFIILSPILLIYWIGTLIIYIHARVNAFYEVVKPAK
jgi:hypothetical protein